jgi:predicted  nucleic acid-binding Zn-ribbon protein
MKLDQLPTAAASNAIASSNPELKVGESEIRLEAELTGLGDFSSRQSQICGDHEDLKVAIDALSEGQIHRERQIESLTSSAAVLKNLQTSIPREISELNNAVSTKIPGEISVLKRAISSAILDEISKITTTMSKGFEEIQGNVARLEERLKGDEAKLEEFTSSASDVESDIEDLRSSIAHDISKAVRRKTKNVKEIQENIARLEGRLNEAEVKLEGFTSSTATVENDIESLRAFFPHEITGVSRKMSEQIRANVVRLEERLKGYEVKLEGFTSSTAAVKSDIEKLRTSIPREISEVNGKISKEIERIQGSSSRLEERLNGNEVKLGEFCSSTAVLKNDIEKLRASICPPRRDDPAGSVTGIIRPFVPPKVVSLD